MFCRQKLAKFKSQPTEKVGINSKKVYNGDLIAKEAGTVDGNNSRLEMDNEILKKLEELERRRY